MKTSRHVFFFVWVYPLTGSAYELPRSSLRSKRFRASSSRTRAKKKEWRGRGRGKKEPLLPSPSLLHLFIFRFRSNFRAITRLETLAKQASRGVAKSLTVLKLCAITPNNTQMQQGVQTEATCNIHAVRELPCGSQPTAPTCQLCGAGVWPDGCAMLMSPNKGETAVHGCYCLSDMAVRIREVLARLWVGVCIPP